MEDAPAFQSAIDWTSELVMVGLMEDTLALQSMIDGTSELVIVCIVSDDLDNPYEAKSCLSFWQCWRSSFTSTAPYHSLC